MDELCHVWVIKYTLKVYHKTKQKVYQFWIEPQKARKRNCKPIKLFESLNT